MSMETYLKKHAYDKVNVSLLAKGAVTRNFVKTKKAFCKDLAEWMTTSGHWTAWPLPGRDGHSHGANYTAFHPKVGNAAYIKYEPEDQGHNTKRDQPMSDIEAYLKEHTSGKQGVIVGDLLDVAPFNKGELAEWCDANEDKWEALKAGNNPTEFVTYRVNSGIDTERGRVARMRYVNGRKRDHLYADTGFGLVDHAPNVGPLKQRFIMPPYSTWNTRDGTWQDRRRLWLAKGICSEEGREGKLTFNIPMILADGRTGNRIKSQTSIFDPVLCELAYGWWCPPGGVVLDPFAGGSVRGIVASVLGLKYMGIELRGEQVVANREQVNPATRGEFKPKWKTGDSWELLPKAPPCDFFFSCPPYGNLEVYGDDPADISNMTYDQFLERYREIIAVGVGKLKPNRFACFVVANYRGKEKGRQMIDLVGDTIRAFEDAGAQFYNDIILINAVGTGAMRANTSFVRGARKVVKTHQNVLVFCKGDPKLAALDIPADSGVNTGEGKRDIESKVTGENWGYEKKGK